jgi:PIN domain nuclease of toxin-antitoxin system
VQLLLDTHVVLWWRANDAKLGVEARKAIVAADAVLVSAASAWEVAIKVALGKLRIPGPFVEAVEGSRFTQLPISFQHAATAGGLPAHHTDPFDRMLVAQVMTEGLTLVTHDRSFAAYGVPVVWT